MKSELMESKAMKFFLLAIILFLSYIVLFHKLGSLTICVWDEARNSINAIEMNEHKNILVTTYQGEIDTWNTKPPLLIIFQSAFIHVFGLSELSVRLPSAIAATIAVIFIFLFVSRYTKSHFIGFFSSFILLTTPGLVGFHGVRTGDYEATLMLFSILYSLFYLAYIETKRVKYLYFFFIAFTMAFMTKSSASLLFLPALFLYTIYRKKLLEILKSKHFYFSLAIPIVVIGAYYGYREVLYPGYFQIVYANEFGGRYLDTIEGHTGDFLFYWNLFVSTKLKYWLFIAISGLFFMFFEKNNRLKRLFVFCGLLSITHLLIISFSETKIQWYGLPEFPFWAIMAAVVLYQITYFIVGLFKKEVIRKTIITISAAVILFIPASDTIERIKQYEIEFIPAYSNEFLRSEISKFINKDTDKVFVLTTWIPQNILFYLHVLQKDGYDIQMGNLNQIAQYDIVFLDEYLAPNSLVESVNTMFDTKTICEYNKFVVLSKILNERTSQEAIDYASQQLLLSEDKRQEIEEIAKKNAVCFTEQVQKKADSVVQNAMTMLGLENRK